ncbi:MAG: hypothetical protein M1827_000209 [Pycnora praestabilis]|nr:MAG: hypothetical protein M1827_000209 [Pycnora praestabilis]
MAKGVCIITKSEAEILNVQHDHLDLTNDAKRMAKQLKGVEAEYVFFAAYLQKDSEQADSDVNGRSVLTPEFLHINRANSKFIKGAILKNFLEASAISGAEKNIRRIFLTTGARQYGVHLGAPKNPMKESDPWINGPGRPPNFYYHQQHILMEAAEGKNWDWVITYPNDSINLLVKLELQKVCLERRCLEEH